VACGGFRKVKIASDQIRQVLQERKRFFVQESFKVYPGEASAVSSGVVTGIIVGQLMADEREDPVVGIGMGLGAALVAAVLGGALGDSYGRLLRINSGLQGYPKLIRWLLLAATVLFGLLCGFVGNWLADKMRAPR
jgi:MFS family permease